MRPNHCFRNPCSMPAMCCAWTTASWSRWLVVFVVRLAVVTWCYMCSRLLLSICKFSEDSVLFALRHKAVEVNGMALQYAVRSPKCQWPHVPYRRFKEGVYNQRLILGRKGWRDERICHLCSAWTDRLLVWGTQAVGLGGMGCLLMSPSMLPSKAEEVVDRDLVLEAQTMHKYCAKGVWIWESYQIFKVTSRIGW